MLLSVFCHFSDCLSPEEDELAVIEIQIKCSTNCFRNSSASFLMYCLLKVVVDVEWVASFLNSAYSDHNSICSAVDISCVKCSKASFQSPFGSLNMFWRMSVALRRIEQSMNSTDPCYAHRSPTTRLNVLQLESTIWLAWEEGGYHPNFILIASRDNVWNLGRVEDKRIWKETTIPKGRSFLATFLKFTTKGTKVSLDCSNWCLFWSTIFDHLPRNSGK